MGDMNETDGKVTCPPCDYKFGLRVERESYRQSKSSKARLTSIVKSVVGLTTCQFCCVALGSCRAYRCVRRHQKMTYLYDTPSLVRRYHSRNIQSLEASSLETLSIVTKIIYYIALII